MALNLGPAKGKDSANGFGPWLVTTDELAERAAGHSYDIAMAADVNGEDVQPRQPRRPVLVVRRDDRVRVPRHRGCGAGDVIGSGTVGTGCILELSRVHGPERLPVPEGGRPRAPGSGAARRDRRYAAARPPTRPPARGGHHMSAGHHLVDAITEPGRPETAGGRRRRLRLHPARRHLVDQQHRVPRRAAGRHQHRRLLDRAAHPRLPARHRGGHRRAGPHPGEHPPPRRPHVRQLPVPGRHDRRPRAGARGGHRVRAAARAAVLGPRRVGRPHPRPAVPHVHRQRRRARRRPARGAAPRRHRRAHDQRRRSPGSRSSRCSSAATSCSTAARRSCSWGRSAGRSRCWRTSWRRWARRRSCPGTGRCSPATSRSDATLDYLRFVLDVAERGRQAGVSPLDAARDTDLGRFADWPDAERIVGQPAPRLRRARRHRRAAAPSTSSPRSATWSPTTAAAP